METWRMLLLPVRIVFILALIAVQICFAIWFMHAAFDIRMFPIRDFGMVIHEFDPWFNYRATEYMAEHGLSKFFKWYDYMSWYPIGRPIGTTTYPGMQITAVAIWECMKLIPSFKYKLPKMEMLKGARSFILGLQKSGFPGVPQIPRTISFDPMSVNDICCMIPPWMGATATLATGLLTYEITRSVNSAVMAMGVMAIIPAHIMRSVGGKFDNEAVAMTAICATFWLWLRSVRTPRSWPFGIFAGLMYIYMVATWGGYIFVLNMVGVHALMLVGLGRFNSGVHKAYSLFFIIGTLGAIQIPVVGYQPLRSLEQMGPLLVFFGFQVLAYCDRTRRQRTMTTTQFIFFRVRMVVLLLVALAVAAVLLHPTGYFGPLSARIRGLFMKHTKTGNPLVDSVAEHQPASAGIYNSYLNLPLDYAYHGAAVCALKRTSGCYFVALYGFIAAHFSGKMSRLVLICGPIVSIVCGIWCGFLLDFALEPIHLMLGKRGYSTGNDSGKQKSEGSGKNKKKKKVHENDQTPLPEWQEDVRPGGVAQIKRVTKERLYLAVPESVRNKYHNGRAFLDRNILVLAVRLLISAALVWYVYGVAQPKVITFVQHCYDVGRGLSNAKVVFWANTNQGRIQVDDYLKGYLWLKQNTPEDSRVIAWWDYGYQITGIANRTTIADGNTWNHEHIATLGRTLTSPEKKAHNAIRHLADYLLVWAGGGGDDLGKSPHLARIGNSVFPDHCGDDDPKCNKFSFYDNQRTPTPMMAKSLLYKAVMHNMRDGVKLDPRLFKEVHTTQRGKMRIYQIMNVSQESKDWIADPKNRVCDAPGSWYCVGQYPPALKKLIDKRRNFAQIEDFNRQGQKSAYTKLIEEELSGKKSTKGKKKEL